METKNIIKDIRKKNNLSQDEMAAKLFVTRQAVSRWENGETIPNIDTLKLISKEFNITINELLNLPEKPICQSCGMNLNNIEDFGTNSDESVNTDYCGYCFQKGRFSQERTLDEMVESNLKYLKEYNAETGSTFKI
jgi:transcriptional regulator with XRE-family HTH domain